MRVEDYSEMPAKIGGKQQTNDIASVSIMSLSATA